MDDVRLDRPYDLGVAAALHPLPKPRSRTLPPHPDPISAAELDRLRRELRLLDAVVEGTTDAVFAKDCAGRYLLMNAAGAAFCGLPAEQLVGKTDAEIFPPDVARDLIERDRRILDGGEPVTVEEPMVIDGRETIWFSTKAPYRDENGQIAGLIGIARDITRLRAVEEARRRLERESEVHQAKKLESLGVLAGGIAHDFNNLLVGILGNADLALGELDSSSPARDSVQHIKTAAKRAAELCREMLAYSGKGRFVVRPTDLNELALEMRPLFGASILQDAHLEYDLASDLPAVEADATQLRQVILNLVTNASDALESQGTIVLRTRVVECDRARLDRSLLDGEPPEGTYVCLEVADTGRGMDAETASKMFDPFFSTKRAGRGLGLAAVQGIVRGHRGALQVDSEVGRGTRFEILLPAADALADAETVRPSTDGWTGQGTVLLIDDEPVVRKVGSAMLERLGFSVVTASNGSEGVRLFRESSDDLVCVILDLTMPGLSGEETLVQLRQIRSDVVVILSSGFNEQEFDSRYAGSGLAGFVQKPYELATLRKTLGDALGTRS